MEAGDAIIPKHETSFQKLHDVLHEEQWYKPILEKMENFTGLKREYIVIGLAFLFAINLMLGVGGSIICHSVGFLYPAQQTIQVIESHSPELATRWLIYWVAFGFLNYAELYTGFLFRIVPFYFLLKCVLYICCFPNMKINGSYFLYKKVIYPIFVSIPNHPNIIENLMETASSASAAFQAACGRKLVDKLLSGQNSSNNQENDIDEIQGESRNLRPRKKTQKSAEE